MLGNPPAVHPRQPRQQPADERIGRSRSNAHTFVAARRARRTAQPIIIPAADKTFGEQQADPAAAEPKSLSHLGESDFRQAQLRTTATIACVHRT